MPAARNPHQQRIELACQVASYALVGAFLALALRSTLMTGLLACCLGFLFASALERLSFKGKRLPAVWCAAVVILTPLVALTVLGLHAKGLTTSAFAQFPQLLQQMAKTVLEIREKLPASLA